MAFFWFLGKARPFWPLWSSRRQGTEGRAWSSREAWETGLSVENKTPYPNKRIGVRKVRL